MGTEIYEALAENSDTNGKRGIIAEYGALSSKTFAEFPA
jgi:hypothetical protein